MPGDPGRVDLDRVGGIVDLDRQVQVFEDPREQRRRLITETLGVQQNPVTGREQVVLQGGGRNSCRW